MSSKSEFNFGEDRRREQEGLPVGTFADGEFLRIQVFREFEDTVLVDPVAWIATDRPLDLGRCR